MKELKYVGDLGVLVDEHETKYNGKRMGSVFCCSGISRDSDIAEKHAFDKVTEEAKNRDADAYEVISRRDKLNTDLKDCDTMGQISLWVTEVMTFFYREQ